MAQQTKGRSQGGSGRSGARGSSASRRKGSANGRTGARSRSSASQRKTRKASTRRTTPSSNKSSALDTAKDATVKGANAAGHAVSSAAKKLKTPAIAAGAGLAGVAGGVALTRGSHKKKVLGVSLPNGGSARSASKNLASAAKNVGVFAERTGRVAEQVRVASEAISESSAGSKSPVEVVLEGLTSRSRSKAG